MILRQGILDFVLSGAFLSKWIVHNVRKRRIIPHLDCRVLSLRLRSALSGYR